MPWTAALRMAASMEGDSHRCHARQSSQSRELKRNPASASRHRPCCPLSPPITSSHRPTAPPSVRPALSMRLTASLASLFLVLPTIATPHRSGTASRPGPEPGYYRYPALHDSTLVFTAEGDLWTVGTGGGLARRLTTGRGQEGYAALSPDGKTIAFSADYEGPIEVD